MRTYRIPVTLLIEADGKAHATAIADAALAYLTDVYTTDDGEHVQGAQAGTAVQHYGQPRNQWAPGDLEA